MDEMLRQANRLANKVFRSSEGGSEIEELASAMHNLVEYIARRNNVNLDENDEH